MRSQTQPCESGAFFLLIDLTMNVGSMNVGNQFGAMMYNNQVLTIKEAIKRRNIKWLECLGVKVKSGKRKKKWNNDLCESFHHAVTRLIESEDEELASVLLKYCRLEIILLIGIHISSVRTVRRLIKVADISDIGERIVDDAVRTKRGKEMLEIILPALNETVDCTRGLVRAAIYHHYDCFELLMPYVDIEKARDGIRTYNVFFGEYEKCQVMFERAVVAYEASQLQLRLLESLDLSSGQAPVKKRRM